MSWLRSKAAIWPRAVAGYCSPRPRSAEPGREGGWGGVQAKVGRKPSSGRVLRATRRRALGGAAIPVRAPYATDHPQETFSFSIAWFSFKCKNMRINIAHLPAVHIFLMHVLKILFKKWGRNKASLEFQSIAQDFPRYRCHARDPRLLLLHLVLATALRDIASSILQKRKPGIKQNLWVLGNSEDTGARNLGSRSPPSPVSCLLHRKTVSPGTCYIWPLLSYIKWVLFS